MITWGSVFRRKHQDVLPRALPELNHILFTKLEVSTLGNLLGIERSTVSTLEVDEVRLHLADLVAVLVAFLNVAELNNGMLLAHAGMFGQHIYHGRVPSH